MKYISSLQTLTKGDEFDQILITRTRITTTTKSILRPLPQYLLAVKKNCLTCKGTAKNSLITYVVWYRLAWMFKIAKICSLAFRTNEPCIWLLITLPDLTTPDLKLLPFSGSCPTLLWSKLGHGTNLWVLLWLQAVSFLEKRMNKEVAAEYSSYYFCFYILLVQEWIKGHSPKWWGIQAEGQTDRQTDISVAQSVLNQ